MTDSMPKMWSSGFSRHVFYSLTKPVLSTEHSTAVPDTISCLFTPLPLVQVRFGLRGTTRLCRA